MSLILNIDTSVDTATICLADNDKVLQYYKNESMKDHAAWVHPSIQKLIGNLGYKFTDLDAIGVSIGPGSYTGLRIGLSTAKGLCYALNIPLITIGTLEMLAASVIKELEISSQLFEGLLICPMIDARRMEVFTAVFQPDLKMVIEPHSLILSTHSFEDLLKRQKILFLGNGSKKFQQICQNNNAIFNKLPLNPAAFSTLTYSNFIGNSFAVIAYTEPLYLKEFFTSQSEPRKKKT
jgi:tRNA threonylcarbamoyladenosine biosynthesis protein TsaB